MKKPPSKVAKKYSNFSLPLLTWAVQTAQIEEFMFQTVAALDQLYIKLGSPSLSKVV